MKKTFLVVLVVIVFILSSCAFQEKPSLNKEYINEHSIEIIDYLFDNGTIQEYLLDRPKFFSDEIFQLFVDYYDYPDLAKLVNEAEGDETRAKLLFDLADELYYYPSAVFGPYFYDKRTHFIHDTDSDCLEKVPYESRYSFWNYECYSLSAIERVIVNNSYLSQFEWTLCPLCIDK